MMLQNESIEFLTQWLEFMFEMFQVTLYLFSIKKIVDSKYWKQYIMK